MTVRLKYEQVKDYAKTRIVLTYPDLFSFIIVKKKNNNNSTALLPTFYMKKGKGKEWDLADSSNDVLFLTLVENLSKMHETSLA